MLCTIPQIPDSIDVLIVGAGPAGLTAAFHLAREKVSVILVDSRAKFGHPLRCGEVTDWRYFEAIGLEPRSDWIRWTFQKRAKNFVVLNREKSEYDLAVLASESGVYTAPGVTLSGLREYDGSHRIATLFSGREKKHVRAKCVLAADGVSSSAARYAGINTHLTFDKIMGSVAFRVGEVRLRNPYRSFNEPLPAPFPPYPYYFWVIPNGQTEANIGLCLPAEHSPRALPLLHQMMESSSACRGGRIVQTVVGMISDTPPLETPYADGLMILGSAARHIDPIMAAGLGFAVVSGKIAALTYLALNDKAATADRLATYRGGLEFLIYRKLARKWNRRKQMVKRKTIMRSLRHANSFDVGE